MMRKQSTSGRRVAHAKARLVTLAVGVACPAVNLFCCWALLAGMPTPAQALWATGGTVTNFTQNGTNFTAHIFTNSGALDVRSGGTVAVLVVGGGGGGGSDMGGGGGAGGFIYSNAFPVIAGNYAVTVGAGGAGAPPGVGQVRGSNGGISALSNSVSICLTALGGGGGASCHDRSTSPAGAGGSGGGASGRALSSSGGDGGGGGYGGGARGTGTPGQGYDGSWGSGAPGAWHPGGGGGAGGPGGNNPAHGGVGVECSILGTPYHFAGGGGGSGYSDVGGNGGSGGGGGGGVGITAGGSGINSGSAGGGGGTVAQCNTPGGDAGANTGGGGGGGAHYNSNNKGGNGGSGIVIVRYIAFAVINQPVTDVTGKSATLNGRLAGTGGSAAAVCVLWGEKNGGVTWDWAKTDWFDGDKWADIAPFSKKIAGLAPNKTYHYTFGAKNVTGKTIADRPVAFITGEVTVKAAAQAWEKGKAGAPVSGKVTVSRPASCTDAPLSVAYAVSGSAGNGTDYAKLSGTVTLPAGAASADIMIAPWNDMRVEDDETVTITLLPGPYIVGAAKAATVTIMDTVVRSFYVSPHATPTPPYDTWAKGFNNLQHALDYPSAKGDSIVYLAGGQTLTGPVLGVTHPDNTVFRWRGANNVMLLGGYRADANLPPAGHPGPRDAGPTILKRTTGAARVLTMSAVSGAVIEQVTIRDGRPESKRGLGGGVSLIGCRDVAFRNCSVVCNTNLHSFVGMGGGMYLANSHVALTDTTVASNTVHGPDSYGGGVYVHRDSRLTVIRSAIKANRAATSDDHFAKGGGYYVVPGGVMEISDTVVKGNEP